ncbi:hypothetical protein [Streptomyces sp. NPDC006477]|uniref:hypothetical protein n=1 Tax=Streptomyces sp. NPDC006477 TaxID=3364747 RepID=UPI0036993A44
MQRYVLFRTGKVDIIGPFDDIVDAADHIVQYKLLGYQILPIKSVDPHEDKPFPVSEQTDENFIKWAETFEAPLRTDFNHSIGIFFVNAEKKFPTFFDVSYDPDLVKWRLPKKIPLIKGLRVYFQSEGEELGLKESKDAVDDYESLLNEQKENENP